MPRTGLTPAQIKEKVILSAEKKIRASGADKMRLVDVAKDVGIAHTGLYKHFNDRDELLDSISKKWTSSVDAALAKIAEKPDSPTKLLGELFLTLHRMKRSRVANDLELFKVFDMAAESKKPFIAQHISNICNVVLKLVKRAIKEDEFKKAPAKLLTEHLLEVTRGFTHPKLVFQYIGVDREPALRQTLKLAFRGLKE